MGNSYTYVILVLLVTAQTSNCRYVSVTNSTELQAAFDDAEPGDEIHITVRGPIYMNNFIGLTKTGSAAMPIRLIQDFPSSGIFSKK